MLSNKVSEIMTTNITTASVTASVFEVMEKMVAEDVGRIISPTMKCPWEFSPRRMS